MFDLIDKLRKRPVVERKVIALTVSSLITSAIFFVWVSGFWLNSSSPSFGKKDKPVSRGITPISSIKENVAEVYLGFSKLFNIGK